MVCLYKICRFLVRIVQRDTLLDFTVQKLVQSFANLFKAFDCTSMTGSEIYTIWYTSNDILYYSITVISALLILIKLFNTINRIEKES